MISDAKDPVTIRLFVCIKKRMSIIIPKLLLHLSIILVNISIVGENHQEIIYIGYTAESVILTVA